jgi:hypothetical protein
MCFPDLCVPAFAQRTVECPVVEARALDEVARIQVSASRGLVAASCKRCVSLAESRDNVPGGRQRSGRSKRPAVGVRDARTQTPLTGCENWMLPAPKPPEKRTAEDLNLAPRTLYEFIHIGLRVSLGRPRRPQAEPRTQGRGNMMFARQAMALLEFACRLYGQRRASTTRFLCGTYCDERRYFTDMPGPCRDGGLLLPYHPDLGPDSSDRTLLAALFDLTRHGLAHQYQSITCKLTDRRIFAVSMSGVNYGDVLGQNIPRDRYLGYLKAEYNDLVLRVFPDALYLDVKEAIRRAGLPRSRPRPRLFLPAVGATTRCISSDAAALERVLHAAGPRSRARTPIGLETLTRVLRTQVFATDLME